MLGLQMFHQHLFHVVALTTGQVAVWVLSIVTRLLVYVIGVNRGQVLATLLINVVGFPTMYSEMMPESLGCR